MGYVLEDEREFERLEKQSKHKKYDYKKELQHLDAPNGSNILDAGCGSGVVTRYLAEKFPKCFVLGCDQSEGRIEGAIRSSSEIENIDFVQSPIDSVPFEPNSFDHIVCRYVMQHQSPEGALSLIQTFRSLLKDGGTLHLIDFDGLFFNFYPTSPAINRILDLLESTNEIDLQIGRKLNHLCRKGGFQDVNYEIDTIEGTGQTLRDEIELMPERLDNSREFLCELSNNDQLVKTFEDDIMRLLKIPGTTVFYNKFIVTAR